MFPLLFALDFLPDFCNPQTVRRWAKFLIAIVLLPVCCGVVIALGRLVKIHGVADTALVPLVAGAGCMFLLYHWLPKPMWLYVFGHEFTHAAAAMACGGRVTEMKVTSEGGHVKVTKDNFFITLAPYFVPVYSAAAVVLFTIGQAVWNWSGPWAWGVFCWARGVTYTFHVLLSWNILQTKQPDITSQGWVFSAVVIFLGNALVLLLGWPLLAEEPGFTGVGQLVLESTGDTLQTVGGWAQTAWAAGISALN